MSNYIPIKISSTSFEPIDGCDENLLPIIFMHGMTATKESWDDVPQVVANKTKRKVYSYDARNHGDSEFTGEFNFDLNVEDLFHFMDSKDIPKAILVGHSMGGHTATNAALNKPERVEAIFSEDMYVKKIPAETFEKILKFVQGFAEITQHIPKELKETEAIKFVLDTMFSNVPADSSIMSEKENLYKTKFVFKKKPDGRYDVSFNKNVIIRSLKHHDNLMKEPSGQFNGPATFIYGSLSGFNVGSEEDNIKKYFPRAKLIEFLKAAHNVHSEFPEEFSQKIVQSLEQSN